MRQCRSKSRARRRFRLIHPMVRSTIHRFGSTTNLCLSQRRMICIRPASAVGDVINPRLVTRRLPVPRQEVTQARGRLVVYPRQDIGEPGTGIDIVELGGGDQGVDRCSTLAPAVGSREQPSLSSDGDAAQGAFGGIVRQVDPAVAEAAGEAFPAGQHVVHRLGHVGVSGELGAGFEYPGFQLGQREGATLLALGRRSAADRPARTRSMANSTSIRRTTSAASGARPSSARSKNFRLACAQHPASVTGPVVGLWSRVR